MIAADTGVTGFLFVMMVLIFILGMFVQSIAIILITTPVILPAMIPLQINPIWYGILLVINRELAQVMPPVGVNLFTIEAITRSPLGPIVRGNDLLKLRARAPKHATGAPPVDSKKTVSQAAGSGLGSGFCPASIRNS